MKRLISEEKLCGNSVVKSHTMELLLEVVYEQDADV